MVEKLLIDYGLQGIVILALAWFVMFLIKRQDKQMAKKDEQIEKKDALIQQQHKDLHNIAVETKDYVASQRPLLQRIEKLLDQQK